VCLLSIGSNRTTRARTNAEMQRMVDHLDEKFHLKRAEVAASVVYRRQVLDDARTRRPASLARKTSEPVSSLVRHCPGAYTVRETCLTTCVAIPAHPLSCAMIRAMVRNHLDRRRRRKAKLAEAARSGRGGGTEAGTGG